MSGLPTPRNIADPDEYWFQYFRQRAEQPAPRDVIRTVEALHRKGRHDHVIAIINGALANDQTQPWMYDVLALSMKLDGRPEAEIDRVLLSRVDFTTTDVNSLLYSAAFLTRLDGKKQALTLYRQSADIDRTRPEPYVLGLKLARELRDVDATEWAATGVLRHVWLKDFQKRHQEAEDAASDTENELLRAGKRERADKLRKAMKDARRRDLMIRVDWSGDGDLDLSVKEPLGTTCSIDTPQTASGGILVHDGYGPRRENSYEEYVCVEAPSGQFEVQIDYFGDGGTIVGKRCQLTITLHHGSPEEKVFRQSVQLDGPTATLPFSLQNGRRKSRAVVPDSIEKPTGALRIPRREMLAKVRRAGGGVVPAGLNQFRPAPGGPGILAQPGAPAQGFRMPAGSFTAGVGFQPVIGFIGEGVSLTAAAVVSADRRFVRISVAPFFNTLREIQTFSFQGGNAGTGQGSGQ